MGLFPGTPGRRYQTIDYVTHSVAIFVDPAIANPSSCGQHHRGRIVHEKERNKGVTKISLKHCNELYLSIVYQLGAEHYIFLRSEVGRLMLGRKGADSGVCVVKTRSAVLVGTYTAGVQPANCSGVMERMADYLIQHNL